MHLISILFSFAFSLNSHAGLLPSVDQAADKEFAVVVKQVRETLSVKVKTIHTQKTIYKQLEEDPGSNLAPKFRNVQNDLYSLNNDLNQAQYEVERLEMDARRLSNSSQPDQGLEMDLHRTRYEIQDFDNQIDRLRWDVQNLTSQAVHSQELYTIALEISRIADDIYQTVGYDMANNARSMSMAVNSVNPNIISPSARMDANDIARSVQGMEWKARDLQNTARSLLSYVS